MDRKGEISLQHKSDEQRWSRLMVNAQAGNESDYRELLTELTQVIHGFLRNRFGNGHFIEDCVQETLITIHQARHTYDQAETVPGMVIRNRATQGHRCFASTRHPSKNG